MPVTENSHSRLGIARILWVCLGLSYSPLSNLAYGQAQQNPPLETRAYGADRANVPDAIATVKSGEFGSIHVDLIVRAGAAEAVPSLKQQFMRVEDPTLKAKIAAGLLRLGDKDDAYWNFLVKLTAPALESDAPDFMSYDAQGKSVPGPSPEFRAWMESHNLPPSSELLEDSLYVLPGRVAMLGWSRDPRAIPLLQRALLSPNHMIEVAAAMGLAEIGDEQSIPLIIEACKKAPSESASVIARALVYFDDNTAQAAVDQFLPKDMAKMYRDAKAHGQKTPLSPPLN